MEKVENMNRNIVFFDGVCHLCNGFVDMVISKDPQHHYLFAPLQGETAKSLLPSQDLKQLDTVIYFEAGQIYYRSAAIVKVVSGLGGVYKLFALMMIIPTPVRDFLYRKIAKNRYKWFGERDFCRLPTPDERAYLLP